MYFCSKIRVLHDRDNPIYLFAAVQEASAPDAIDLVMLADNLENKQLTVRKERCRAVRDSGGIGIDGTAGNLRNDHRVTAWRTR